MMSPKTVTPVALLVAAGLVAGAVLLTGRYPTRRPPADPKTAQSNSSVTGRVAAQSYCQTCHAVPDPETLDRKTWRDELFPKMRYFTGLTPPNTNLSQDLDILLAGNVLPKAPLMSEKTWDAIVDHYVSAAPENLVSTQDQETITVGLKHFTAVPARFRRSPPHTTLVRILPTMRMLMMGDAQSQGVDFLDPNGALISSVELGNIPVGMTETGEAFYFPAIGHFFPREEPRGQLLALARTATGLRRETILSNLPRTTDVQFADLTGDGREDFTLCMYGNFIGRFSWFETTATGRKEHVLLDKPGAIRCAVHDFNGDGNRDLVVLVAQAEESVLIYINDGRGRFTKHRVFQRQPSWGHSGLELADFDGDGQMDLLVTNGDNGDFSTAPTKPYHGIRIYRNKGNLQFEESWFFHLNGAYQALARDFDQDGDLDIAAISFFPDYEKSPRESFVYLENEGGLRFTASTFRECISGRWLTMDAGDLDGDGDDDLALGSLVKMPSPVPDFLKKVWYESGPSVMILQNNLRKPRPSP
ncbi:MAG TPA: FG-GAP-like repeat-containing protein [Verrucomicrobiae bacterium]|nr:FG-GAP-like repeat-containing protein [Verrucomicrobiae bacterium]